MSSDAAPAEPAPAGAADGAPVQKTEKQLKREAEKKAKKEAEAAKKAAKLAARQVRGQGGGGITVGVVQNPHRPRASLRHSGASLVPRAFGGDRSAIPPRTRRSRLSLPSLRVRARLPRVRVRVAARPLVSHPRSRFPDARGVRSRVD